MLWINMVVMWIWYVLLDITFTIVRIVTNPIVPIVYNTHIGTKMRMWLPYEYSLDYKWFDTFLGYDWDKHYKDDYKESLIINEDHHLEFSSFHGVKCIDSKFTLKEKLLRYLSRLVFLYNMINRSTFSFEVTGVKYSSNDNIIKHSKDFKNGDYLISVVEEKNTPAYIRPFLCGISYEYSKHKNLGIHFGWELMHFNDSKTYTAKIIYRVRLFEKPPYL